MKLISWNCNGAFCRKYPALNKFNADIWIIPESESPQYLAEHNYKLPADNHLWCGDRPYRGLSVFSFHGYKIRNADFFDNRFKHILPIIVTTPNNQEFLLITVWACRVKDNPDWDYIGQMCYFMEKYSQYFDSNTVMAGDFNINMQWNKSFKKEHNYTRFLQLCSENGLYSLYHQLSQEPQGQETIPTSFYRRNPSRGFHIDYIYLPQELNNKVKNFQIHGVEWLSLSDHVPLELEI